MGPFHGMSDMARAADAGKQYTIIMLSVCVNNFKTHSKIVMDISWFQIEQAVNSKATYLH